MWPWSTAQEAHEPFGLVLLDAVMPGLDGFALAERIKQHPGLAEATIMMLTASGQRGDAVRCRELGIASYLTKPIKQSELLDAILTVLGRPSEQDQPSTLVTRHSLRENRQCRHILLAEDSRSIRTSWSGSSRIKDNLWWWRETVARFWLRSSASHSI